MTFYAGQKVLCVSKGTWAWHREHGMYHPLRGRIYTIRENYEDPYDPGVFGVRLDEIRNPACVGPLRLEIGFRYEEFVPVIDRKTDISIFQRMLIDKPQKVQA